MKTPSRLILYGFLGLALLSPFFAFAQDFVPLTNLPGIRDISRTDSLPSFLNNLYRLCIGAAAVIAILQIMRGGVYLMFNKGSVAHNEKAKSLIGNSILGLLLVLSPAIVFGIINPDILNLRLNLASLQHRQDATVDAWIDTCNITASTEQRACAGSVRSYIQQSYQECKTGNNTTDACINQAQDNARTRLRACIGGITSGNPALTRTQNDCVDQQVLSWLGTSGLNVSNQNQNIEDFDRDFRLLRSDDNTNRCGTLGRNYELVPRHWCNSITNIGGGSCCGKRLASGTPMFHLVTYQVGTQSGGGQCYRSSSDYFATNQSCTERQEVARNMPPPTGGGVTWGRVEIVVSCTQVTDRNYTLPAERTRIPRCSF